MASSVTAYCPWAMASSAQDSLDNMNILNASFSIGSLSSIQFLRDRHQFHPGTELIFDWQSRDP